VTKDEALKMARTALGVQLDAMLGKAGHLRNDDRRRYAENGIKAIDEALAQPEQEPVAWVSTTELLVMRGNAYAGAKDWRINLGLKPEDGDVGLYTTPPQRTWVGLTDEDEIDWKDGGTLKDLVNAIEAKLKEKNI
jgi:hypothetical protein